MLKFNVSKYFSSFFMAANAAFCIGVAVSTPTPFQIAVASFSVMVWYTFIHSFDNS